MSVILNQYTKEEFADGETVSAVPTVSDKKKIYNNLKTLVALKLTSLIYMVIFTFINFMTSDINKNEKNVIMVVCILLAIINLGTSIAIATATSKKLKNIYNIGGKKIDAFKLPIAIVPSLNTIMYLIYNIGESKGAYDEIFSLIGQGIEKYYGSEFAQAQRNSTPGQSLDLPQSRINIESGPRQQPTVPQTGLSDEAQIQILQQTIKKMQGKDKDLAILQREHNTTLTLVALTFTFLSADFTSMFPVFTYLGKVKEDIESSDGKIKFGFGSTFATFFGTTSLLLLIGGLFKLLSGNKQKSYPVIVPTA